MTPNERRSPAVNGTASKTTNTTDTTTIHNDELAADLELRCAWLTVHADRLYAVDPGGLLSSQLRDLRDLLGVAQARGWFQ